MENQEVEILLVEDNPADVELTLRALKTHRITNKIMFVRDGAEALDYLYRQGPYKNRNEIRMPRLILLDLKLPKISGLEVLQKVKSDEELKKIPIVVLTSSKEEPDIRECYRLGVNSYIVKPVDFEKFIEAVRNIGLYWLLLNQGPTD